MYACRRGIWEVLSSIFKTLRFIHESIIYDGKKSTRLTHASQHYSFTTERYNCMKYKKKLRLDINL